MSETADGFQREHRIAAAMEVRHRLITNGTATWHDFHQHGVLLSELAETVWMKFGTRRSDRIRSLLMEANECFLHAYTMLSPGSNPVHREAVACDHFLTRARLSRIGNDSEGLGRALDDIDGIINRLKYLVKRPSEYPTAWHQLAIAYAFSARLLAGSTFGFPCEPRKLEARSCFDMSTKAFQKEIASGYNSDGEQAYRSMLLYQAMFFFAHGEHAVATNRAGTAYASAWRNRDLGHMTRSFTIATRGIEGEVMARTFRDRKLLRDL